MQTNQILQASLLDIIFDKRNKTYGAYELRNRYGSRLLIALYTTAALSLLAILIAFFTARSGDATRNGPLVIHETELTKIENKVDKEIPAPIPPKPVEPPRQDQIKLVTPRIEKDHLVTPEDEIRDIEDYADSKISTVTVKGEKGIDITEPPVDDVNNVVIAGPKEDEADIVKLEVDIQAKFPGGEAAWRKYIAREIEKNMDELEEDGKTGTCTVLFVVDKEGRISDVEALTMKGTKLAEICVNAIRKGPNWIPAELNGQKVMAFRRQPVVFSINAD